MTDASYIEVTMNHHFRRIPPQHIAAMTGLAKSDVEDIIRRYSWSRHRGVKPEPKPLPPAPKHVFRCETVAIIEEIGDRYGIALEDMVGECRTRGLTTIRHLAYAEVKRLRPHMSYPMIGRAFGDRDHTTILSGIRQHHARMLWVEILKDLAR